MATITIIAFLAILLQVNYVFSQFSGGCRAGETSTGNRCLGFVGQQCPPGEICRRIPLASIGVCCRPSGDGRVCPSGSFSTGETCGGFVGARCPRGTFCQYVPFSDFGNCCRRGF